MADNGNEKGNITNKDSVVNIDPKMDATRYDTVSKIEKEILDKNAEESSLSAEATAMETSRSNIHLGTLFEEQYDTQENQVLQVSTINKKTKKTQNKVRHKAPQQRMRVTTFSMKTRMLILVILMIHKPLIILL